MIFTLIEQKKGTLPVVKSFTGLSGAQKALLERVQLLSTDYKRDEPIGVPQIYSNYVLENTRGTGEEILLRIEQTDLLSCRGSRHLDIPLPDSLSSVGILREALAYALDKIEASIYRNDLTVKFNNDPDGHERENSKKAIESLENLKRIYENKLQELNYIDEHFYDENF